MNLLKNIADKKNISTAQLCLAWMLHKYNFVVPIPGMRSDERILENLSASDIELSKDEFNSIEDGLKNIIIYGNRTDEDISKLGTQRSTVLNKK